MQVVLHFGDSDKVLMWDHESEPDKHISVKRVVQPAKISVDWLKEPTLSAPVVDIEEVWFELDYYDANLLPHYVQCDKPNSNYWDALINTGVADTQLTIHSLVKKVYELEIKKSLEQDSIFIKAFGQPHPIMKGLPNVTDS